ncbi:MAG: hypothetical protein CMJ64_09460 [Planctomycetaceae bacterium]|nr:hypothetical protein [Planctomycetaceae bacterium]
MVGRHRSGGFVVALVLGVVFTGVGFSVAYFLGLPMLREAKASESWPTTDGVITVARVESKQERREGKTTTMYSHHIEYRYSVNDEELTGSRVWTTDGHSSSSMSSFAKKTVQRYPVGKEVKVFYDPEAPAICALEPGTTWMTYLPLGLGGLFFVIGVLITGGILLKVVLGMLFVGVATTTFSTDSMTHGSDRSFDTSFPQGDDEGIDIQ